MIDDQKISFTEAVGNTILGVVGVVVGVIVWSATIFFIVGVASCSYEWWNR